MANDDSSITRKAACTVKTLKRINVLHKKRQQAKNNT